MANETTLSRLTTSPPAANGDPYFYGWRMVPRLDEHNRQKWEKVPLTAWDVLHPEEEDFIVNNDAHDQDIHYLKAVFEDRIAGREGMRVLCDHRVLWEIESLGAHGPDIIVFQNLNKPWNILRGTFPVKEMGATPVVIVEVTSPSTRYVDLDEKVEDYYKAGVPLYIIADRRETKDGSAYIRLLGYRSTPGGYTRLPEEPKGIWIESLKVWVGGEDDRVICADEHGTPIPDLRNQRDAEKQRADAAEQKLKELEAELKRLRSDAN